MQQTDKRYKKPLQLGTVIISEIIGKRPVRPSSYNLRKLRGFESDIEFCKKIDGAISEWEEKAEEIRGNQPKEDRNIDFKNPDINVTVEAVIDDFLQIYKIQNNKEFQKVNPYSNTNEPELYLKTLVYYFLKDDRFFESPLLNKKLSEPSFEKGTLSIGGYGCGKTTTFLALAAAFKNHCDYVKKVVPGNMYEILAKFDLRTCVSSDIVNQIRKAKEKKISTQDIYTPLQSSRPLLIDDILREEDVLYFGKENVFKNILTLRADRNLKLHLTLNYLEIKDSNGVVTGFKDTENSLFEFRNRYDGRVHDRLFGVCNIIELSGKSFRR